MIRWVLPLWLCAGVGCITNDPAPMDKRTGAITTPEVDSENSVIEVEAGWQRHKKIRRRRAHLLSDGDTGGKRKQKERGEHNSHSYSKGYHGLVDKLVMVLRERNFRPQSNSASQCSF